MRLIARDRYEIMTGLSMTLDLTQRQRIALRNPCFEAEDTIRKQFYERHILGGMSSILTLNVGME